MVCVLTSPFTNDANSTKSSSFKSSESLKCKVHDIFNLSAPGAAKLLNPFELSVRFGSSSEFIVSSVIFNPILPVGLTKY